MSAGGCVFAALIFMCIDAYGVYVAAAKLSRSMQNY